MPRTKPPGRKCSICEHPRRAAIERAWIEGASRQTVADEFKVSYRQLVHHHERRHSQRDIEAARAEKTQQKSAAAGGSILESLDDYRDKLHGMLEHTGTVLTNALNAGDPGATLAAVRESTSVIRECTRLLELTGKLTGELDSAKFNLFIMPAWFEVRDTIFGTLEGYPEARQALLDALKRKLAERAPKALLSGPSDTEVIEVEAQSVPGK